MNSYNSPSTKPLFKGIQIVWYILSILETLLVFRLLLKIAGANPVSGFVSFIYGLSGPFVLPFASVFPKITFAGSVLEWSTVLAMIVYGLIAWGIVRLFLMSKTVSTPEAAEKLKEKESETI